jgi:ABC-type amino acid transport substrate-binding protein
MARPAWFVAAITAVLLTPWPSSPGVAADTLTVCVEEGSDPYSWKRGKDTGGSDLLVSQAVAQELGRDLSLLWFETENEEESFPDREANALLSAGLCDLVAGYPLYKGALGEPAAATGTLPGHEGARPGQRGKRVPLGVLVASRPYHHVPFQVIVGPKGWGREIETLSDLKGLRLGAEQGTLTDTIFMAYRGGYFASDITHLVPQSGILARMEEGAFDAVIIELHRFDAYLRKNPDTRLRATDYRHALGFNMGFVILARRQNLRDQLNKALDNLIRAGKIEEFSVAAGITFVPPTSPEILDRISPGHLFGG